MVRAANLSASRVVATLIAIFVVCGCGSAPPPTQEARASARESAVASRSVESSGMIAPTRRPTVAPTLSPTPVPPPPADLPTRLVKSKSGIRVTIELDRNPLPAGEPMWATVTVQNRGRTEVTWFHDGCAIPVHVFGDIVGSRWRPGRSHDGQAARFKDRLLDSEVRDPVRITFTHERYVGKGPLGCADVGIVDTIPPGQALVHRSRWDGMAADSLGLPPSGQVDLTGLAQFYYRGEQPPSIRAGEIELHGEAWIVDGKDPSWLDPPEVIDAALTDPAFLEWLDDKQLGNGISEFIRFDQRVQLWEVGVITYYATPVLHFVRVHPVTGVIIDTVERPWRPEVDGNL